MALRLQASLVFDDEDVYKGLIEPFKKSKNLNKLIVRCLTAYFYDEEVRKLVEDGNKEESEKLAEDSAVRSPNEICDNLRNLLAIQNFMSEDLSNIIEDGKEDFAKTLDSVNSRAEETGMVKPTSSEFGNRMYRVEMKNQESTEGENSGAGSVDSDSSKFIMEMLMRIMSSNGDAEGMAMINQRLNGTSSGTSSDTAETPRKEEPTQVSHTVSNESTDFSFEVSNNSSSFTDNTSTQADEEEELDAGEFLASSLDGIL